MSPPSRAFHSLASVAQPAAVFGPRAAGAGEVGHGLAQDHALDERLGADAHQRLGCIFRPRLTPDRQGCEQGRAGQQVLPHRGASCKPSGWRWALMKRVTKASAGFSIRLPKVSCCTIRPSCMSSNRSPRKPASPRSCVTSTTVLLQRLEGLAQVGLEVGADDRVEGAERLVQEQQRRVEHQGAHQADALPLPSGHLRGIMVETLRREAGQLGQLFQALADAAGLPAEMAGQERDVAAGRQVGEQAAVLHDEADALAQLAGGGRRHLHAVEGHGAFVGRDEAGHKAHERGLAAAAGADEDGRAAGRQHEVRGLERGDAVVGLRDSASPSMLPASLGLRYGRAGAAVQPYGTTRKAF